MSMKLISPMAAFLLAACSGNSLNNVATTTTPVIPALPGTAVTSNLVSITRYEERTAGGNGYAEGISYDALTNTFTVDNLAFDGDAPYTISTLTTPDGTLNGFLAFEAPGTATDQFSGTTIDQFEHRAVYGESASKLTRFGIVRTGAYTGFGFGGFVYERTGGVVLPTGGQAVYSGNYGGIRDFNGAGGLEYVEGSMTMAIDFDDFNSGSGVSATVSNRVIRNLSGTDITASVLAALNVDAGRDGSTPARAALTELPAVVFSVGPGVLESSGEIRGSASSPYTNGAGTIDQFATGNYYAVLAGPDAREVAGIIVIQGDDHRTPGVTVRETGGFILVAP